MRAIACWLSLCLVASVVWVLSPVLVVAVEGGEGGVGSFERRLVAALPAFASGRVLAEPEVDGSDLRLSGVEEGLLSGGWRDSFDPEVSVVVGDATTATRLIYENEDGSETAVISPEPVRFLDGDEWREIDLDLVEDTGGVVPEASPAGVVFPSDPGDGMAVHESAAGAISVGLPSLVNPVSEGVVEEGIGRAPDRVVMEGEDGVESVVTPLSSGFRHDVVFPDRSVAEASFTVDLVVPEGVTASSEDGGVVLWAAGEVVARYGGGVAFDAVGAVDGSGETPVVVGLVGQSAGRVTVGVSVDEAWLDDGSRVFPVTIDPTYTSVVGTTSGGGDTYVNQSSPNTSFASAADLRIGRNSGGEVHRSFVRFGLGGIPSGSVIYGAEMRLVNFASTNCTASLVRSRLATGAFGQTTTWSNQPTVSSVVSDSYFAMGPAGCPGGWASMDATSAVVDWYAGMELTRDLGHGLV